MKSKKLILLSIFQFIFLFISILISTYIHENGDRNSITFKLLLTTPIILIFCIYNSFFIYVSEKINNKLRIINYILPIIPIIIYLKYNLKEIYLEGIIILFISISINLFWYIKFFSRTDKDKNSKKTLIFTLIIIIGVLFFINWLYNFENNVKNELKITNLEIKLQNGDIIFQTSKSKQSKAIQIATKSKYSHVGIIYKNGNKFYVYEAVQPVKLTPLKNWINKGEHGKYVVKRLINAQKILTPKKLKKMKYIGNQFKNKNYDIYFDWSDKEMYCSELVWKIYKRALNIEVGKLEKLKDFDLSNPEVKKIIKKRYGNDIPLNETVISPASIFNSDKLKTVLKN